MGLILAIGISKMVDPKLQIAITVSLMKHDNDADLEGAGEMSLGQTSLTPDTETWGLINGLYCAASLRRTITKMDRINIAHETHFL